MIQSKQISLKELIQKHDVIITAGAGDALSARIANDIDGIDAILSSGFAISAQQFGLPDAELYTRSDNVETVSRMTYVSSKPLIADIDTGYGNAINVIKTVHEFERAGAEGVIIEDQISPKRCPICVDETNTVLPAAEAAGKIKAAAENKLNKDTIIIARTDATNIEEAIKRAKLYHEAGADLVQPISRTFKNKEEVKRFVDEVSCPVSLVIVGWLEDLTIEEIRWTGAKLVHFALISVTAMHQAVKQAFTELGNQQSALGIKTPRTTHNQLVKELGMGKIAELEEKYLPDETIIY
ncbi:isocitrate lyase/PEP mutase family protein [Mesobacillus harenae]|uniref:isocitrate lyase/PEP mutase family protein n=1 Tax=Mesobacillus harenae TaxID=2213203 RepID=UPI0015800319|nr:isocitrate lyase/PEP mutase family protein [Mesobacillus harenae]